jgi:uncharacterized protein (DUF488 family)
MPPNPIHTIGHSTREADELVELLRQHGVDLLVDVRRFPGSRRHPQFNRELLAADLSAAGIRYRHAPELGGRRSGSVTSPNLAWRNPSFRAYADHLATPEFRVALDRLLEEATGHGVALMCRTAARQGCGSS